MTASEATASSGTRTATVPPSAPDVPHAATSAAPEHRTAGAAIVEPACADIAAVLQRDSSVAGRSRKQRIVDCVGGWLKNESQELRDGFKREIEEFRTGVDKVGVGLQWLGGKLRR